MLRLVPVVILLLSVVPAFCEDTLQDRVAATDMTNADAVYALAMWCHDHRLPTTCNKYLNLVLKIDTDNPDAREALGFVRVGERWVPKQYAPAQPPPGTAAAKGAGYAAPPGPTAAQISWDLTLPVDPDPSDQFIDKYIERLPTIDKEGDDMDISVATCIDPKYWKSACPRLCAALLRDNFTDLYGASTMVMELGHKSRTEEARPLLPFLMKASTRITTTPDLDAFCWALAVFKDKRCVPRLIELMQGADPEVAKSAASSVSAITHLPSAGLDAAKAQVWWNENCNISEQDSLHAQLGASDDTEVLEAVRSLYVMRDKALVPALIRLLSSAIPAVRTGAIDLFSKITGNEWGYDAQGPDTDRAKIVAHITAWWKESGDSFAFPEAPGAAPVASDEPTQWVTSLDAATGTTSQEAETSLRARGMDSVPALLNGLGSPSLLIRLRCYELLKAITGQAIDFDAHDTDQNRATAVQAWRDWYASHLAGTDK